MADRDPQIGNRANVAAYLDDYAAWLAEQAGLLREGRYNELDVEYLLEELESLAGSDFKAFVSAIRIVLLHMLKWDIQTDLHCASWANSIHSHREQMMDELEKSPSYKSRIDEAVIKAYKRARVAAADQTGLPLKQFPEICPFSWPDIRDRPFIYVPPHAR
jgi:hypothetical protein